MNTFLCYLVAVEKEKKKRHSASTTPPRATPSPQQIRQQLQLRLSATLRAQRAARRKQVQSSDSDDQQPSTSERSQRRTRQLQAQASASPSLPLNVQDARVVSPTLLRDRRLTASVAVVHIKRADSDVEVNVTDSANSEGDSGDSRESEESSSTELLRGRPRPGARNWDVTSVIEKGRRKVVLLSMLNQQGYSSDSSSVQSARSSAVQTRQRARSKSQDSETGRTDSSAQDELRDAQGSTSERRLHRGRPRRMRTEKGSDFEGENRSTQNSDTSQDLVPGRPRQLEQRVSDADIQDSSDDNNNLSGKDSSVEGEDNLSLSPCTSDSKYSPRRTRSASLLHHKRASDSSSEERRNSGMSLAKIDHKRQKVTQRRGKLDLENRPTETKGKSQHKYQSDSADSSTSSESLSTQVRYRRAFQRALRSSRQRSKVHSVDNTESCDSDSKSKSHLSTDVRGLRSRTVTMTTGSKLGSSSQQGRHTSSAVRMSAIGSEQNDHPATQETEKNLSPTEVQYEEYLVEESDGDDSQSVALSSTEVVATTSEKGDSSVGTLAGQSSQMGTCRRSVGAWNQSTSGEVGPTLPDNVHTMPSSLLSAYAQFQVPKPQLKKEGRGASTYPPRAVPVSAPPPLIPYYTEALAGTAQRDPVSSQPNAGGAPSIAEACQLGIFAVQSQQGDVSSTQAGLLTAPTAQSYPVVADQSRLAGGAQLSPAPWSAGMASSSVSFVQWIQAVHSDHPTQVQAGDFSSTQPCGAVVVPTSRLPPVAAAGTHPHPVSVTGGQPYPVAVTPAAKRDESEARPGPYPVAVSSLPVPPALAQHVADGPRPYAMALSVAEPELVERCSVPAPGTSGRPAPTETSSWQSAPGPHHQQKSAVPSSQLAPPVPVGLYAAAGNATPVIESHSMWGGRRRVGSHPEVPVPVPVPVSLFRSSAFAPAPTPSSIQQCAPAAAQPVNAVCGGSSLQAVATSQTSTTTTCNVLRRQLTTPAVTRRGSHDPSMSTMLRNAGLLCETVSDGSRETQPTVAQVPAGNQQRNRPETCGTAAPAVSQQIRPAADERRRDRTSAPWPQSSAPLGEQPVVVPPSTSLPAVSQSIVESPEQSGSLPMSRGKIWLSPEPMQALLIRGSEVVVLSDSEDSDMDLRITGMTPPVRKLLQGTPHSVGHSRSGGCCKPRPRHAGGGDGGHQPLDVPCPGYGHSRPVDRPDAFSPQQGSAQSQFCGTTGGQSQTTPSDAGSIPSATAAQSPSPATPMQSRPPCPVHGYHRLVRHPTPSVLAKRNPDGSLTIDLTDEEPAAKKACLVEPDVTLLDDSDVEIL